MSLSVNGTSQSYGWEYKDQASFRNAGPNERPRPSPQPASCRGTDDFRAAVASQAKATGHRRRGDTSAAARNTRVLVASTVPQTTRVQEADHAEADSDGVQLLARRAVYRAYPPAIAGGSGR